MIDNNNNKSWAQFVFGCCCCVCDLSANRVMYLLLSLPGFARFVGECRRGTKPEHSDLSTAMPSDEGYRSGEEIEENG